MPKTTSESGPDLKKVVSTLHIRVPQGLIPAYRKLCDEFGYTGPEIVKEGVRSLARHNGLLAEVGP